NSEIERSLQKNVDQEFHIPREITTGRFHCFCKNSNLGISEIHSGIRASFRKCKIGSHTAMLVLVHGADIRNNSATARQEDAIDLAREIRDTQKLKNIKKTILLGDFNMNPYESGMNMASGFNAMMTKACIQNKIRKCRKKEYDFYYNPMWSLLGDSADDPSGTYYYQGRQGYYGWNMLDQVLVHHAAIPLYHNVKILTKAGDTSLKNRKGRPDSKKISDHFPILLELKGDNCE
ncbi:hypothetical protein KAR91_84980, partial [Candidatus Pacearchaeota archaeon]|nr:hypothetical protein [Candidatus Pacearchaeota archaeon]